MNDFASESYKMVIQDDEDNIYLDISGIRRWEIPYYFRTTIKVGCNDLTSICFSDTLLIDNLIFEVPCIADNRIVYISIEREECIYGKK